MVDVDFNFDLTLIIQMDSLKCLCERTLKHHIDDDSALFLLSLADQYNAATLRVRYSYDKFHYKTKASLITILAVG